eukprot:TRINITY_DN7982_c0_g1_i1.p1 TRINITY_DN7982_c0_g1~~TRINITY_DN7982_c0_g1_i1.p1  ORF type:complete len:581 (+),score=203.82 TRINITY_DN7982_c0_g1_i1:79-1821(+)
MEDEDEPSGGIPPLGRGTPGSGEEGIESDAERIEALEAEITRLKGYINQNYNIFIKRLEKRKDRISALSEENGGLKEKLSELEGYKKQMLEYRENFEQLEDFQNQEMAKIKHMLLSSENALQTELKSKEDLLLENKELKESLMKAKSEEESKSKDAELTTSSSKEDPSSEQLRKEKEALEVSLCEIQNAFKAYKEASSVSNESEVVRILENQLSALENERDEIKNNLLEMEIDRHDALESEKKLISDMKLNEARMCAERETLEVKLSHRESEIKKLKEELRNMKESNDLKIKDLEEGTESKTYKVQSLESLISELKGDLSRAEADLDIKSSLSLQSATSFKHLESECQTLGEELKSARAELKESKCGEKALKAELVESKRKFASLNKEFETCVSQMEELSGSREALEMELRSKSSALEESKREMEKYERRIRNIDENLPETIRCSDFVKGLESSIASLQEQLEDKKSALKLQDKRLLDMKKTLQKELSRGGGSGERDSPPLLNGSQSSRKNSVDVPINDVNVTYLKRAIFQFFTGRDDEAYQMIKVISTILKFSSEETKVLHEFWEWKHSWFASKPKIKT